MRGLSSEVSSQTRFGSCKEHTQHSRLVGSDAILAIALIWPSLLLWPLDKCAFPRMALAQLAWRGNINLACDLARPTKVARAILPALVVARASLHKLLLLLKLLLLRREL